MEAEFANIPDGTTNRYQLSAAIDDPAGGWSAGVNPSTPNPLSVEGPGGLIRNLFFDVTAPSGATPTVLRLTLTREGADTGNRRSAAYRLQMAG